MPATKDHFATFERPSDTFRITHDGKEVARSESALLLTEHAHGTTYPIVVYLPASSLTVSSVKTDHSTHCPLKGDASYWTVDGVDNGVWSYESPHEGVEAMAGYIGFDSSRGFTIEKI